MTWDNHGVRIADPEQVVLESDPYRRLSYTWHTFTPGAGRALRLRATTCLARLAARAPLEGDLRDRAGRRAWSSSPSCTTASSPGSVS